MNSVQLSLSIYLRRLQFEFLTPEECLITVLEDTAGSLECIEKC